MLTTERAWEIFNSWVKARPELDPKNPKDRRELIRLSANEAEVSMSEFGTKLHKEKPQVQQVNVKRVDNLNIKANYVQINVNQPKQKRSKRSKDGIGQLFLDI